MFNNSALIIPILTYTAAVVNFQPASIEVTESDSVGAMLCVAITGIPSGGLESALQITFGPQTSGGTAGQYSWLYCSELLALCAVVKLVVETSVNISNGGQVVS